MELLTGRVKVHLSFLLAEQPIVCQMLFLFVAIANIHFSSELRRCFGGRISMFARHSSAFKVFIDTQKAPLSTNAQLGKHAGWIFSL